MHSRIAWVELFGGLKLAQSVVFTPLLVVDNPQIEMRHGDRRQNSDRVLEAWRCQICMIQAKLRIAQICKCERMIRRVGELSLKFSYRFLELQVFPKQISVTEMHVWQCR